MTRVPVLEIGVTHVTAAWVDAEQWRAVPGSRRRMPLDSDETAAQILSTLASYAGLLGQLTGSILGVAIPEPFDYERGIGQFEDVTKFEALNGVDVGAALIGTLPDPPAQVRFLNDADAFGIGEWSQVLPAVATASPL